MSRTRAVVICPGRGSYGKNELGSYPKNNPILKELDTFRLQNQCTTLTALDSASSFVPNLHLAGENASLLTFAGSAMDWDAIDREQFEIVAITGNSMGWYGALYCAGVLSLQTTAQLIETMAQYQKGNLIGAQVLYPTVTEDWESDPALLQIIENSLQQEGVELSIRLGGSVVLGVTREKEAWLLEHLPKVQRNGRVYPFSLPLHSAFHTSMMQETSERAQIDCLDLPFLSPQIPLVAGNGKMFRFWSDIEDLWEYTLNEQVTQTYDFSKAIQVSLSEFAPDVLILLGPGFNLGAPIGQAMVEIGWQGMKHAKDFKARQQKNPILLSMGREQDQTFFKRKV